MHRIFYYSSDGFGRRKKEESVEFIRWITIPAEGEM